MLRLSSALRCHRSIPHLPLHEYYYKLNPFIDFEDRLLEDRLKSSIEQRNLNVNLEDITQLWKEYKSVQENKTKLEKSKSEVQEKIKSIVDPNRNVKDIEKLKLAGKVIRQDLKNVTSILTSMEEKLLQLVVRLPNDLDEEIFPEKSKIYFTPISNSQNHLDIGKKLGLVDYIAPTAYFLKNQAADFELDIIQQLSKIFRDEGFIQFSNPDFSRSLIIEGLGEEGLLKLSGEELYLHGSASFLPFCSFHCRQVVEGVPLRYFAHGRHYQHPFPVTAGLFTVSQSSAFQIFLASSRLGIIKEFEEALALVTAFYQSLGLPFRLFRTPPSQLQLHEAARLSIQVHSPFRNEFFEAGNLSFYTDYISKRLRMYYKEEKENLFLHVISGTVLKVPPLIAALLEYNGKIS